MRRRWIAVWLAATTLLLASFVGLRAWSPGDEPIRTRCGFRRMFGLACPTCGMTRALAELAKGSWSSAARLHPLAPPLAIEVGIAWMIFAVAAIRPDRRLRARTVIATGVLTVAAFFVLWIVRVVNGTLPP